MPKNTKLHQLHASIPQRTKAFALITIALVFAATSTIVPRFTAAQSYDAQIRELQNQNSQVSSQVAELRDQAASYQEAIANFESQINAVAEQIAQQLH